MKRRDARRGGEKRVRLVALLATLFVVLPLKAQSADTLAPLSAEFLLNDVTVGRQTFPRGDTVGLRSFVVSWTSELDREKEQIVLQHLQCGGGAAAADVPLEASHTSGDNTGAQLANGSTGNLLAWGENKLDPITEDLRDYSVIVQFIDDVGKPVTGPFRPTGNGLGNEFFPNVASAPDGSTVLVWIDYNLEPGSIGEASRIRWQRFNNSLTAEVPIVDVAPFSPEHLPINPDIAVLNNGNVVTVTQELARDGSGDGIALYGFASDGTILYGPVVANTSYDGHQQFPRVLAGPDGKFVVAWQASDDSGLGVFAQVFDAEGVRIETEIRVNQTIADTQDNPSLTRTMEGFLVGWRSHQIDSGFDVFTRGFDWQGNSRTDETQLNVFTEGDQQNQFGMMDGAGNILFVWESPQDGDRSGIVGRFFDSADRVCGDVVPSSGCRSISATDALAILRSAVSATDCEMCQCDIDGSDDITSTDALLALRIAIGLQETGMCASC
jgi:hypothetical protein